MRIRSSGTSLAALAATLLLLAGSALAQPRLRQYDSKYYVIYTDLGEDAVREASVRMTAMAELYYQRTRGFAGKITKRFPFYLFKDRADYLAAGGMEGSAGMYDPNQRRLLAFAGSEVSETTWYVVRHEGFHQFAHNVIGGELPVWVNEGLAEYFAEAIFTGDGYVTGAVPPERLNRIQFWIRQGNTISVENMMSMPHALWNAQMSLINYDQAWSMVYFLAHARGGRYQDAFNSFLRDLGRGDRWQAAWQRSFGAGTREFEKQYRDYWQEMSQDISSGRYAQATAETLTSFLARAVSQKQAFASAEEFFNAARAGKLQSASADWLPPSLLESALKRVDEAGSWELRKSRGVQLVCTRADGTTLTGSFQTQNGRVKPGSVKVKVK